MDGIEIIGRFREVSRGGGKVKIIWYCEALWRLSLQIHSRKAARPYSRANMERPALLLPEPQESPSKDELVYTELNSITVLIQKGLYGISYTYLKYCRQVYVMYYYYIYIIRGAFYAVLENPKYFQYRGEALHIFFPPFFKKSEPTFSLNKDFWF